MGEPADSDPDGIEIDGELVPEVRRLPVRGDESLALAGPRPASAPATIAAAVGGFVLGVATFLLVRVLRRPAAGRSLVRGRRRPFGRRHGPEIASTRRFLVDVHQLKR